ncbi:MAG TPA: lytic transglycosylase domain-containing protein [Gemmatimonadales bacterium]
MHRSNGHHMSVTQRLMLKGLGIFVALVAVGGALSYRPGTATADADATPYTGTAATELHRLYESLDATSGALELTEIELHRARALIAYSAAFGIPADLAAQIYDAALRTGLAPELAFQIVRIESNFNPNATSRVGAVGLTQLMLRTAVYYEPDLTREQLYDPVTNLRIGLRFFRDLLERYHEDLRLALLAYNRGPGRVGELLAQGRDPRNGYATSVIEGYRRAGPVLP